MSSKSFYFEISENEKETMSLVINLLERLGIKVREATDRDNKDKEQSIQNKLDSFNKIAGSIKVDSIPTIEERDEIRASRYVQ